MGHRGATEAWCQLPFVAMGDDVVTESSGDPAVPGPPADALCDRPPDPLSVLLDVQAHDLALDRLAYRLRELAERGQLEELNRRRAVLDRQRVETEEARAELSRRQDEIESHVQALVSRVRAIEQRLRSGAAGSYRDQEAMATETGSLEEQRRRFEDDELEIMEQLEPLEEQLAAMTAELADLDAERAQASEQLAAAEAAIAAERATVVAERAPLVALLPLELGASYERLRSKLGGIGAARLVDGACSGCHLRLPSKERDQILHAPAGTVFYCDQCGRILVP